MKDKSFAICALNFHKIIFPGTCNYSELQGDRLDFYFTAASFRPPRTRLCIQSSNGRLFSSRLTTVLHAQCILFARFFSRQHAHRAHFMCVNRLVRACVRTYFVSSIPALFVFAVLMIREHESEQTGAHALSPTCERNFPRFPSSTF
jgi:hypothetical protein